MRSAISRWRRWPSGVYYHTLFWQFLPVAIVFYTACLVHTGLGIWALYERRQFRWKAIEPLQLVLGLSIPALIIAHVSACGSARRCSDMKNSIRRCSICLLDRWRRIKMWLMFAVMVIAWMHGCIGLYFWLRMKAFYKTRRAVSAGHRGADSDAGHARHLSGRTQRRRQRQRRMAGGEISSDPRSGTVGRTDRARSITDYLPDRLSRACSALCCWQRARVPCMSAAAA